MVLSRNGKWPHLVKCGKGGRVSCDSDCLNWKSLNICSHFVVVAEMNSCLPEFIDYYRKSTFTQYHPAGFNGCFIILGGKETVYAVKEKN